MTVGVTLARQEPQPLTYTQFIESEKRKLSPEVRRTWTPSMERSLYACYLKYFRECQNSLRIFPKRGR